MTRIYGGDCHICRHGLAQHHDGLNGRPERCDDTAWPCKDCVQCSADTAERDVGYDLHDRGISVDDTIDYHDRFSIEETEQRMKMIDAAMRLANAADDETERLLAEVFRLRSELQAERKHADLLAFALNPGPNRWPMSGDDVHRLVVVHRARREAMS